VRSTSRLRPGLPPSYANVGLRAPARLVAVRLLQPVVSRCSPPRSPGPRWLVLSTYLVALLLLLVISVSVWTALVFPAWVFMVSVLVLVAARRKTTGRRTA
jgi:hypothetical protein